MRNKILITIAIPFDHKTGLAMNNGYLVLMALMLYSFQVFSADMKSFFSKIRFEKHLFLALTILLYSNHDLTSQTCGAVGSIIISEVGPKTSSDPGAEYVEFYNTTDAAIDLTGWVYADESGSSPYVINSVNGAVVIPAGGFLTFSYGYAFNTVFSPFTTDHVYGGTDAMSGTGSTMTMSSCNDGVELTCLGTQITDFYWGPASGDCPATNQAIQTSSIPVAIANGGVITSTNYSLVNPSPGGGGTGQILPVELSSFIATNKGNDIHLLWQTITETNNKGFEIERSAEGKVWEEIGFVAGQGDSNAAFYYEYQDNQPFIGNNYYRLRQVDFDGQFEYSPVVSVEFGRENGTGGLVYPNPATNVLYITMPNPSPFTAELTIFQWNGQAVLSKAVILGTSTSTIEIDHLPVGLYFVQLVAGQELVMNTKFVKKQP